LLHLSAQEAFLFFHPLFILFIELLLGTCLFYEEEEGSNLLNEEEVVPSEISIYTSDFDFLAIGFPFSLLYLIVSACKTPFNYNTKLMKEEPRIDMGVMVLLKNLCSNGSYFPFKHH